MSTLFTKIVQGEIPSYKIAEDDRFYAFLDINPVAIGHTLVIPKEEIDYLFDLPDDLLGDLMAFSKKVATAIEKEVDCKRIGITVVGLEVPHAHVHLIPIDSIYDMEFSKPRINLTEEEFSDLATRIAGHV
ncbi:HIT family protein [Membranicola marinus]|uniref:HIT family protein n=1 Tax=Membranihabitans marinus TaxID=1227546 RepID=A0A953HU87_9BACT|nr:HIT family protein [Membranihabitans marinus]MBY5956551.1 HIT family protein [Membranihabitans marinus]